MRGATLLSMIQDLRRELRLAENTNLGRNTKEGHAQALRSAQHRLYSAHDWPFKTITRDIPILAGSRYYAPPANMDLEDIRDAHVLYNGQWTPIERGITITDYNAYNPDTDTRVDPVLKWDLYNDPTDNGDMIEVWPLPASANCTVRLKGQRKLGNLVADADVADMDNLLVVLFAAADLAPPKDRDNAMAKAQAHLFSLRRNLSNNVMFVNGGGTDAARSVQPPRIVIASGG